MQHRSISMTWWLGVVALLMATAALTACGDEVCEDGDCECEAGGTCDFDCSGGSCNQQCAADSECTAHCEAGDCSQQCSSGATCTFLCEGGGCRQSCLGNPNCTASCEGDNCTSDVF